MKSAMFWLETFKSHGWCKGPQPVAELVEATIADLDIFTF
jgi:hypothetical protein